MFEETVKNSEKPQQNKNKRIKNKESFINEEDDIFGDSDSKNSMLKYKSQSDELYDHYTKRAINENRIDESATNLYQILKIH